jgi:hypothetical protein
MSKSSSRRKTRRLWLKVKFDAPGASNELILKSLINSIDNGDYWYPKSWRVAILWSNKEDGELKKGEWTKELRKCAQSSEGFQFAVRDYLKSQLEQL